MSRGDYGEQEKKKMCVSEIPPNCRTVHEAHREFSSAMVYGEHDHWYELKPQSKGFGTREKRHPQEMHCETKHGPQISEMK